MSEKWVWETKPKACKKENRGRYIDGQLQIYDISGNYDECYQSMGFDAGRCMGCMAYIECWGKRKEEGRG